MASIKDIAKKAGVSISTVSYALNGSPKVTEETSAKILAIAKELNYVPNAAARTLKMRKTKIIGAFLSDYGGPFYGPLLYGMREALNKRDYDLIVCSGQRSHRLLPEGMIDGAIVLDETFSNKELLNHAERGNKIIVLDREIDHPNIDTVLLDNQTGTELAIQYLIGMGHHTLYFVTGPEESYDSVQRLQAALRLVERNKVVAYKVIQGDFNKKSGELAARQIVNEYKTPVAVFCFNDVMAIGMYDYLATTDYIVGEHVHIIGFDNIELARYIHPRLSTIQFSKAEWGAKAAEQLICLLNNKPVHPQKISVTLKEGDSVQERRNF
ncbi:LacI family DNA-binding transcriptional regulator [Bacillus sp. FJAT-50079]|uniref:LacI family DNA-binding transcriptional regulator n=1 Tax=Bacillus sp. FJAT-50079 TaxID=2833577 RepID=UPI001BCA34D9|nr:LacI family DNA-binding transcriptional regulator [Bacillus sp. FJAT-50079]MBS4206944.1 LacI family DNA-binding transcriptional regulator [Bacillus sp. FJAT-50079]